MATNSSPRPVPKAETACRGKFADSIAATLRAYGTRFAFGIPGNDVLELIRACEDQGIEFVLAKSEPAAAFMADAVYQVSGKPSVLIPALGPGVANAMADRPRAPAGADARADFPPAALRPRQGSSNAICFVPHTPP